MVIIDCWFALAAFCSEHIDVAQSKTSKFTATSTLHRATSLQHRNSLSC